MYAPMRGNFGIYFLQNPSFQRVRPINLNFS
jgi:hypothetical protein